MKCNAQLKQTMYDARLNPPRNHSFRLTLALIVVAPPSQLVQRNSPAISSPAQRKRVLPVTTGGHVSTSHFVPVLLPPQRKMPNARLTPIAKLVFPRRTNQFVKLLFSAVTAACNCKASCLRSALRC